MQNLKVGSRQAPHSEQNFLNQKENKFVYMICPSTTLFKLETLIAAEVNF